MELFCIQSQEHPELPLAELEAVMECENIDATIIAQKPKMRPHIDTMRENIANTLGIEVSQVNVKATTEEGLGFTGAMEGISAQAICMLNSPFGMATMEMSDRKCEGCQGCQK